MLGSILHFFFVVLLGELLAIYPFQKIRSRLGPRNEDSNHDGTLDRMSRQSQHLALVKGILERSVLCLGLINGFPDILALFGALKVATRLREAEGKITNDYYFIGNFTSVGLAIAIAAPYESGVARDLLAGIFQCLAGSTASPPPAK